MSYLIFIILDKNDKTRENAVKEDMRGHDQLSWKITFANKQKRRNMQVPPTLREIADKKQMRVKVKMLTVIGKVRNSADSISENLHVFEKNLKNNAFVNLNMTFFTEPQIEIRNNPEV